MVWGRPGSSWGWGEGRGGKKRVEGSKGGFEAPLYPCLDAHFRVPAFKNTTKIPRKDPQEKEERKLWRERKKARNFGPPPFGPPPFDPPPFGPPPFGPPPLPPPPPRPLLIGSRPGPEWFWPKQVWPKQVKRAGPKPFGRRCWREEGRGPPRASPTLAKRNLAKTF